MKTPRVSDFDPNAKKEPTLKSSMEDLPVFEKPPTKDSQAKSDPVGPVRVVPPTPQTQPKKRIMKTRHPFDIYQDQYESLKQLSLEDRMSGGMGSMSEMVREALDKFISERKKK